LKEAKAILSCLVDTLREKRILTSDAVEHHTQGPAPTDDLHWLRQGIERWKRCFFLLVLDPAGKKLTRARLVFNVLRADTHLALLSGHQPFLSLEEVSLGIPASFATWNAYGFNPFYKRLATEPRDRQNHSMREFSNGIPAITSGLLIEDVDMGLWGLFARIRSLTPHATENDPRVTEDYDELLSRLRACEERLLEIRSITDIPEINAETAVSLINAYRGGELPSDKGAIFSRIKIMCFNTMMFCRALCIQLHLQIWNHSRRRDLEEPGPVEADTQSQPPVATNSSSAQNLRYAVWSSLETLVEYEKAASEHGEKTGALDPLVWTTLALGVEAVKCWSTAFPPLCWKSRGYCVALNGALSLENPADAEIWLRYGGTLAVQSIPFCYCQKDYWLSRFMQGRFAE
jgi:hypothetical protein